MTLQTADELKATSLPTGADEELGGPPRETAPTQRSERISSVDVLRGFALLGILVVNIDSFSALESLHDIPVGLSHEAFSGPNAHLNLIVLLMKWAFIENKMRGLFSLLFGAGVILLTRRTEQRAGGLRSAELFLRRNMWLVLIGVLHGMFIWGGDILLTYGMTALTFLYPCRNLKPRTLLVTGTILWAGIASIAFFNFGNGFQAIRVIKQEAAVQADQRAGRQLTHQQLEIQKQWIELQAPLKTDAPAIMKRLEAQRQGGYLAYVEEHGLGYLSYSAAFLSAGGFLDALGAMLIGMALMKNGFLAAELRTSTYLMTAAFGFLISIPLSVVSIWKAYAHGFSLLSMDTWIYSTAFVSAEAGTLAAAATIILIYKNGIFQRALRPFGAVGQTALTNYLFTSILCQWIFTFGPLKLYGKLEYFQTMYVVFAVWSTNLLISSLWLRKFEFGPCEWLWRSLTYWKLQPLRIRDRIA
jgi:uncharacterized protein